MLKSEKFYSKTNALKDTTFDFKSLIEKYGVALIKHYYDEAKDYYSQQEKLKEQINKLSDVEVKTKVVKKTSMNSNKKSASLIDLGNLLEGGDSN